MRANWREIPNGDIMSQFAGIYVSMNPKGLIAMSRATYQMLDEPKAFLIFFDDVNNRVGLKPAALSTRNAFRASTYSRNGTKVRAYRLIRECRIDLPQTVHFPAADIDEDGILILDLRTSRVPARVKNHYRNRNKHHTKDSGV
jgi:hypothetical protein